MSTIHRVDRLEDIPEPVPDGRYVVVDVIISSTTIIRLLEEGASYVRPFADPAAALEFKERTQDAVLVGEDGGDPIEGFDLSPLPSIIREATIEGLPVGIRTSNGTRAIERIGSADGIYVGSTINAAATARELAATEEDVWIVAAGRQGNPIAEDIAGARLINKHLDGSAEPTAEQLKEQVRTSVTAEWLRQIGFENELEALLSFNSSQTVPRLEDGLFVAD